MVGLFNKGNDLFLLLKTQQMLTNVHLMMEIALKSAQTPSVVLRAHVQLVT